jgi:hypothetical protein
MRAIDGYLSVSGRSRDDTFYRISNFPLSLVIDGYVSDESGSIMHILGIRDRLICGGSIVAREYVQNPGLATTAFYGAQISSD